MIRGIENIFGIYETPFGELNTKFGTTKTDHRVNKNTVSGDQEQTIGLSKTPYMANSLNM